MRKVRDLMYFIFSIAFSWLYIPHFFVLLMIGRKRREIVVEDVEAMEKSMVLTLPKTLCFLYLLHNNRYFRNLFYHRIGSVASLLIGWWRPGDRYFVISKTTKIGEGAYFAHPFSTEINAKSIGKNFSCRHLTTIGNKRDGDNENRPVIGDNVTLGVNVTIIGPVTIGNNVIVGAGSVVVKDVPANCVVAGNPAKIIKTIP